MTDSTKWYVFWIAMFAGYSCLLGYVANARGYEDGSSIENARKIVLDDLGKSLEYQLSIKQMVNE